MARVSAALYYQDKGRVTAARLAQMLLTAVGPSALVAAIDLGAPFLVDTPLLELWQVRAGATMGLPAAGTLQAPACVPCML